MTKTMTRPERLALLVQKERELRKHADDVDTMTNSVDGARIQLENAVNEVGYAAQEISGQVGIVKGRQRYVIEAQDKLKAEIKQLRKELGIRTQPGDSK